MKTNGVNILETFITELELFEENLSKINKAGLQRFLDKERLENFGIQSPNSMFYISLFRSLGLIDEKGKTTDDYLRFMKSKESAKIVFAEKIKLCYDEVFKIQKHAHKLTKEKSREIFQNLLKGQKSDTFIRMIADTYKTLIDFADFDGLEKRNPDTQELDVPSAADNSISHDEFILELMNDADHTYNKDSESSRFRTISKGVELKKLHTEGTVHSENNDGDIPQLAEHALKRHMLRNPKMFEMTAMPAKSKEKVASVLEKKAGLLLKLERNEEAISIFDQILQHFNDTVLNVTEILLKKAELLEKMKEYERALNAYDAFLESAGLAQKGFPIQKSM